MKKTIQFTLAIVTALLSSTLIAADNTSTSTHAQNTPASAQQRHDKTGTPVSFNQLPAPVQKAFRAEAGNLNLENVRRISLNDQTAYQASFDKTGMKAKVTVAQDGSLLQYRETDQLALVSEVPKIQNTGMTLKDLPHPVQKTIKAEAGSNQVGDISKDTESGQTVYHAAYNDGGVHTDLVLDAKGKVLLRSDETALFTAPLESTHSLSLNSAPKAVQDAVRAHGGTAKNVTDIDKGTWNGQTAYRVMIDKNGSERPLLISENGQILQRDSSSSSSSATGAPASSEKSSGTHQNNGSPNSSSQSSSSPKSSGSK